jgi:protein-disulfide isomerase
MIPVRLVLAGAICAAATLAITGAHAETRVALVIGNGAYENVAHLTNPANDAKLVADSLKRDGFGVTLADDLDRDSLAKALRNFRRAADNADWAVVYYAGHGMEIGGINYLIPVDAKLETDRDVGLEAVPLEQVTSAIEGARAFRLVILDACRDNPFVTTIKRSGAGGRDVARGLGRVEPAEATLVAFSAKDGSIASDGDGADSPYALALAKHLTEPGIEVSKMFRLVYDDVQDATGKNQQPVLYGSVSGRHDFFFRPGTAEEPAAAQGSTVNMEAVFWQSIERSTVAADFRAYLNKFPDGVFAELARTRIAALEPAVPRDSSETASPRSDAAPSAARESATTDNPSPAVVSKVSATGVPYIGDDAAPVVMTYWYDYQCPYCRDSEQKVLSRLITDYVDTGKVKVVFKDVAFVGQDSLTASYASRAVLETAPDKFFIWYKTVLDHQGNENNGWASKDNIIALTRTIPEIDADKVERLMTRRAGDYRKKISANIAEANAKGIKGVPAVSIGTELLVGYEAYDKVKGVVDAALRASAVATTTEQ